MSNIKKFVKIIKYVVENFLMFFIISFPGPTGRKLRYFYYRGKFKRCGKNVMIDEGVIIQNPDWISVGDAVWIDKYVILQAGKFNMDVGILKKRKNTNFNGTMGELIIGNNVHIGAFNILQAQGGLYVGNNVTTSSGVKMYSFSNYFCNEYDLTMITHASCMAEDINKVSYIVSPIVIENNVWIALDCLVLGGTIGKNSFISSKSLVLYNISENSYASGNPAKRIRERFENGGHAESW